MSFTALGATGRNEEVPFEAQGIHLAQALARAGGLIDNRSSPQGVFVFRFEPPETFDPAPQGIAAGPDGRIPVVYRVDLTQPQGFFVLRTFPVQSQDIVFVSNAPAADLQKFLNLVFSVVYPLVNVVNATR
jgi:polysaccharide export outer membrane protein